MTDPRRSKWRNSSIIEIKVRKARFWVERAPDVGVEAALRMSELLPVWASSVNLTSRPVNQVLMLLRATVPVSHLHTDVSVRPVCVRCLRLIQMKGWNASVSTFHVGCSRRGTKRWICLWQESTQPSEGVYRDQTDESASSCCDIVLDQSPSRWSRLSLHVSAIVMEIVWFTWGAVGKFCQRRRNWLLCGSFLPCFCPWRSPK